MDEAEYCHRLALMYRGKVIALGTPAELKEELAGHTPDAAGQRRIRWRRCGRSKGMPGVSDVAVFGSGLHVTVDGRGGGGARFGSGWRREGIDGRAAGADRALDGRCVRGHDRGRREEGRMSYRRTAGDVREGAAPHHARCAQPGDGAGACR